jgi:hypothetical protein
MVAADGSRSKQSGACHSVLHELVVGFGWLLGFLFDSWLSCFLQPSHHAVVGNSCCGKSLSVLQLPVCSSRCVRRLKLVPLATTTLESINGLLASLLCLRIPSESLQRKITFGPCVSRPRVVMLLASQACHVDARSTAVQPDNPYGASATEPYSRLQAAVSTLSAGPVAPSDKIGYSNATLIMMSCMKDGTLLQASVVVVCVVGVWCGCLFERARTM